MQCLKVNDVRQTEICTHEPHVAKCSALEIEMAIEILQNINHGVLIERQWNCLNVVHSVQCEYLLYLQIAFVNTTQILKKLFFSC